MRLVTDTFAYCRAELPAWNTISISGYHMREAGATAVQEVAFTIADAIAYSEAAIAAGMAFDDFAPRLSFFFAAHNDLFEEAAKFRAARAAWARVARDRFGARDPRSMAMRFHVQTGGSTLTAQQPETNVVRTTVQALSAILGGAQSLHTNASDEALGLPTPATARLALRTQQVLAAESGVSTPVDPLGGSYYVEALTDEIEARVHAELAEIDRRGGTLAALADGYQQAAIAEAAYVAQRAIETGERIVVGVNAYAEDGDEQRPQAQVIDPQAEAEQVARTIAVRAGRDPARRGRGDRCARGRRRRHRERGAAHPRLCRGAGHPGRDQRRAAAASGVSTGHDHRPDRPRRHRGALDRRGAAALSGPLRLGADRRAPRLRLAARAPLLPASRARAEAPRSSWSSRPTTRAAWRASWRRAARACTTSA